MRLALVLLLIGIVVGEGFIRAPIENRHAIAKRNSKDESTYGGRMQEATTENFFYANLSVGTPPQVVSLLVDTGSAEVFVKSQYWNINASSTANLSSRHYSGSFGPGNDIGFYMTDTVRFGSGKSVLEIKDYTLAWVNETTEVNGGHGILGLSSIALEAKDPRYDNFMARLVKDGLVDVGAFSVYWNAHEDYHTGELIFGGFDAAKVHGEMVKVPFNDTMFGDYDMGYYYAACVLDSLVLHSTESSKYLSGNNLNYNWDIGSFSSMVPFDIYHEIAAKFNLREVGDVSNGLPIHGLAFPCGSLDPTFHIDFQFGEKIMKYVLADHELLYSMFADSATLPDQVSNGTCVLDIYGGDVRETALIGLLFMRDLVTVFNIEEHYFLFGDRKETRDCHVVALSPSR